MRIPLVTTKRILIFESFATNITFDFLLHAAVETQNVSLGIRSLRKVFATYRALRLHTSLPKQNELFRHEAFKIIEVKFGKVDTGHARDVNYTVWRMSHLCQNLLAPPSLLHTPSLRGCSRRSRIPPRTPPRPWGPQPSPDLVLS